MTSLVAFTSAVFFSASTPVTRHMTGDPRIVTESPTLSGLVVMPIVSHKPTLATIQTAAHRWVLKCRRGARSFDLVLPFPDSLQDVLRFFSVPRLLSALGRVSDSPP